MFPCALLAILTLLLYGPTMQFGFVGADSAFLITENPLITDRTWHSMWTIFTSYDPELYTPLSLLSFKIEYFFFGSLPAVFHATNVILHTINACLVFFLAKKWSRRQAVGLLCALLFVLHPINTEAVSWIAGRKDLLMGTFYLAALLSFEKQQTSVGGSTCSHLRKPWPLLFFLLALLSKGSAITLPLVLLLLQWKRIGRFDKECIRKLVPFFLLSGLFVLIGLGGKGSTALDVPLLWLPFVSAKAILHALWNITVPTALSPVYALNLHMIPSIDIVIALVLVMVFIVTLFLERAKMPMLWFAAVLFMVTIWPGFFVFSRDNGFFLLSDRYLYIPMIAVLYVVSSFLITLGRRYRIVAFTLCVALGLMSFHQSHMWRSDSTAATNVVKNNPSFGKYYYHLGTFLLDEGKNKEAKEVFLRGANISEEDHMQQLLRSSYERL